jgi:hypothetical protein
MGPDLCDKLRLADHLAGTFDQSDQEIEDAASDRDRLIILQHQPSCGEQPKGTEADLVLNWVGRELRGAT